MDRDADPESEPVQALARRWQELIAGFTQNDPELTQSVGELWRHERPELERQHGDGVPSAEVMAYMGRALNARR